MNQVPVSRRAKYRVTLWTQRHRTLARLVARLRPGLLDRLVWAELESDPVFVAGIQQGMADADAGRMYRAFLSEPLWRLPSIPCSSWKPDDPSQPDGWYHDGRRWRLRRDGGWFRDAHGFWRYNHPGDPGWTENPDGSWRYVKDAA